MSESIKCSCSNCGAKYRLPLEAQGRTARCKRCGGKFEIPRQQSLEDSILTWLTSPEENEPEEAAPARPRVISMSATEKAGDGDGAAEAAKRRGPIRIKSGASKSESA